MSINGFAKAGWFLVGLGVGIFGTTLIYKHELEKPVGEFEEYIPLEDREGFEDSEEDCSDSERNYRQNSKSSQNSEKDISRGRESRRDRREQEYGQGRRNNREEERAEFSSYQSDIFGYYRRSNDDATRTQNRSQEDKRRKEFEEQRGRDAGRQATQYSKMYKDEDVEKAIHAANEGRNSKESFKDWNRRPESYYSDGTLDVVHDDDFPSDDYVISQVAESDLHDEYTLERVEENIEIFLDDNPQDFVTMIFYEGDNTLCDDGEQIVPNAEEVIGLVALSRLIEGGPGAENGVIFVHNLKTSLNYEVVLDAGSYQDTVIGQFESHLNGDGGIGGRS